MVANTGSSIRSPSGLPIQRTGVARPEYPSDQGDGSPLSSVVCLLTIRISVRSRRRIAAASFRKRPFHFFNSAMGNTYFIGLSVTYHDPAIA
ncbi:MAG: hypothetical protein ACRERS_11100, partial [Methylococcales bacterium]